MSVDTAAPSVRQQPVPARRGRAYGALRAVPSSPRPVVVVLFGGSADAYDVSCASAAAALETLDAERYEVVPIQLCKGGQWVVGDAATAARAAGRGPQELAALLAPDPGTTLAAGFRAATETLRGADVALPAMHSRFGADGTLQSVLDTLGVAYVGSGVHASTAASSAAVTRRLLASAGVSAAPAVVLRPGVDDLTADERRRVALPARVVPVRGKQHPARVITRWGQLPAAVAAARRPGEAVMVEHLASGRRVELGVLELPDGRLEVGAPASLHGTTWPTYELPARLEPGQPRELNQLAVRTFRALGCQGLLQLEVALPESGGPLVTGVDTLPPLTPAAPFLQLWRPGGRSYADVLDVLIRTALTSGSRRRPSASRPARAG